jgi:hypothetical protein
MGTEKDFVFASRELIANVDFLKWTSTLGEEGIRAIETPMRGIRISPAYTELFGFARDELGVMLAMDAREAPWLEHLSIAAALHGYDDRSSLLLMTKETVIMDTAIPPIAIEIHVPLARQDDIAHEKLLGFCLLRHDQPTRVGRIVPLHTPGTWREHQAGLVHRTSASGSFFAGA